MEESILCHLTHSSAYYDLHCLQSTCKNGPCDKAMAKVTLIVEACKFHKQLYWGCDELLSSSSKPRTSWEIEVF